MANGLVKISRPVRPGSVLGVASPTWLDAGINLGTLGIPGHSLSHLAIAAEHPESGESYGLLVFESIVQSCLPPEKQLPCIFAGKVLDGWQAHPLEVWVHNQATIQQGNVWHYPLCEPLYPHEEERLTQECLRDLGKPYDAWGAWGARTLGLGWAFHIAGHYLPNREDLDNLFCSEGVNLKLRTVGRFPDGNASRWNPNHTVRVLRRWGILLRPYLLPHKEV